MGKIVIEIEDGDITNMEISEVTTQDVFFTSAALMAEVLLTLPEETHNGVYDTFLDLAESLYNDFTKSSEEPTE